MEGMEFNKIKKAEKGKGSKIENHEEGSNKMHDSHEEFNNRIELESLDVFQLNKKEDSPALNLKSSKVNQEETKSTEAEKSHKLLSQDLHSIIKIDGADSKN